MTNYYSQLMLNFLILFQNLFRTLDPISEDIQTSIRLMVKKLENDQISEHEFELFVSDLINTLNEPVCAWKIIQRATLSQFLSQLPVIYLCSAPNIETCLKDFKKYRSLILPPSYVVDVYSENDMIVMEVSYKGFESPVPLIKDDTTICLLLWILRQNGGTDFDYVEISFPVKRSQMELELIANSTNARITCKEGNARAYIAKIDANRKNLFFNKSLHVHMATQLETLRESLSEKGRFIQMVVSIIEKNDRPAAVTQDIVADTLGKSVSTFRRMLAADDSSFKQIQNKVIDEKAVDILLSSEVKIESIGLELGYTERSAFERAFKRKFGVSPALFREQGRQLRFREKHHQFFDIVEDLPPLPDSCKKIINEFEDPDLNVEKIVSILDSDPIFGARIMGMASKAMFGRQPKTLWDAVSLNLGVETVKNLAQVYVASDFLADSVKLIDVSKLITAITIGPKVFRLLIANIDEKFQCDMNQVDQMLTFGLLSFLLIFHEDHLDSSLAGELFHESDHLFEFLEKIESRMGLSVFGISGVLLSSWGIGEDIVKPIAMLDQIKFGEKGLQEFVILTLAICIACSFQQKNATPFLKLKAAEYGIQTMDHCLEIARGYIDSFSTAK